LTTLGRRADRRLAVLGASEEVINLLSDVMPRYEVMNCIVKTRNEVIN
jgi:hypothetical protein